MTILTRYILGEFLRILFLALGAMAGLFVVIDFFEKIDEFVLYKSSIFLCISYYLNKLPRIVFLMTPVAFLLSTVITIGSLSRNSELTAMKSCGLSLMRVSGPILAASLVAALLSLIANEFVVPFAIRKANHIFHIDVRNEAQKAIYQKDRIWYRSNDGSIWQIGLFNAEKMEMRKVSIFMYQGEDNLTERIDAARAVWKERNWIFYQGVIRTFGKSGSGKVDNFQKRKIYFPVVPDDFVKVKREGKEMTLREIYYSAQKVKKEGMDNSREMVAFHRKISYPFISFVMALIGIPFSLKSARSGGVVLCVGISLAIGFSYYFIFNMGVSLGNGGTLPPFLAAWGANFVFMAMGLYLILSIDSESILPRFFAGKKETQT